MGKDKKAVLSTPWRHIRGGKVPLYSFFGTTGKLVVSFTPSPLYLWQRTPVPIEQEATWASARVGKGANFYH
jgi:hypothetical protein